MRTVLLTGGTRGLGLAVATRLSADGYHVVATGRKLSSALQALMERPPMTGKVSFRELDLNQVEGIGDIVTALVREHGPLYGVVNNAAIGAAGVLATMHDTQVAELLRVNLLGTILVTKYALRSMLLGQRGRIVNIASIIASTGFSGLSVYAATKAALVGFTKSLARETGKLGITVNSVSPGYMETDMSSGIDATGLAAIRRRSPMGKLACVDDVAGAIAYLLSEEAGMVTGINLTVDGGSTA